MFFELFDCAYPAQQVGWVFFHVDIMNFWLVLLQLVEDVVDLSEPVHHERYVAVLLVLDPDKKKKN